MRRLAVYSILALLLWLAPLPLEGRVLRVEVASREPVLGGKSFGQTGPYERIAGRVYFSVAAANAHNRTIVDLERAANLRDGEVEFSADFVVVQPKNVAAGNGSLLLEIPNRGNGRIVSLVDGGDADLARDAGDGWLLRQGFSIATIGWQWDAVGERALKLYAPIAKEQGKTITGLVRGDLMPSHAMEEIPLGHLITGKIGGSEYPVFDPTDKRNTLTVRDRPEGKRQPVARAEWQFAHQVDAKIEPSNRYIRLAGSFQPGRIYEYIYVAADPVIAGLGFAAVRDFASYSKYNKGSICPAKRVYGEGISQNGRFLRDLLYQDFERDEEGRPVLDGVLAHVAGAGRGSFNYRFAQPSRDGQPTSSLMFPTDLFPFADLPQTDPATGKKEGLLDRAVASPGGPKIFLSNTSYEYWGRSAALIHTSADGRSDAPISPSVRVYFFPGLQHYSGPFPPANGSGDLDGQQKQSFLRIQMYWRAMIANMDAWVRAGVEPPPSSYPHVGDGTLVAVGQYQFPALAGVNRPGEASVAYALDFGGKPGLLERQPPKIGKPYPALVPQADADGNDLAGVRRPELRVPLATYTGWNLRDPSIGAPSQRVAFEGSYLPFAKTKQERERTGDPRLSIEERYGSRAEYQKRFAAAVDELIEKRWALAEDRAALLEEGEREWDLATR